MSRQAASRRGERGFTLAALLVIITVLALVIAYTVPVTWSDVLRRERDKQTIFAMRQYARAIADFQKKTGAFPTTLDQLKEQKKPRILRNEYPDPLTGKVDWLLIPATPNGAPVAVVPPAPVDRDSPADSTAGGNRSPGTTTSLISNSESTAYTGPFAGVRPPVQGRSFLSLKGINRYELWSFTSLDLVVEAGGAAPVVGMAPGGGPIGRPPGSPPGGTPPTPPPPPPSHP